MNKLRSMAADINSSLSIRKRNQLVIDHEDILLSKINKEDKIRMIMAREKRSMGIISYFVFSLLIRAFLEILLSRLDK